jgi:hypothetical protein
LHLLHADFHFSRGFWPGHKLCHRSAVSDHHRLADVCAPYFYADLIVFASPPLEVGADNATARLTAGAENQTVLLPPAAAPPQVDVFYFYYGPPPLSVIEISFAEPSSAQHELL